MPKTPFVQSQKQRPSKVDRRGHVRTSRQEREKILDQFERSGLSAAGFAREYGINYKTFGNWIRARRRERDEKQTPAVALAEVVVAKAAPSQTALAQPLRIELPGGATFLVTDARQVSLVVQLLQAL